MSGSCRMLGSPGLRSDLRGQFFSTQCFSWALQLHAQKAGILCVSVLLTKKKAYYFKVNTDDPIIFVILQQFNELPLHIFHKEKLNAQLGIMEKYTVNLVYYGKTQTYSHFESTAEIPFLWIKSRMPSLIFHSVLKLGYLKPFLMIPNLMSYHSIHADWIYGLSHLQFQNLHYCHRVLHHDQDL